MKTVNLVFSLLFLFAAVVQYNDPDPLPWLLIYGFSAILCGLYVWKPVFTILPAITGIVSLIWMIFLLVILLNAPSPIIWADVFGEAAMKTESVELTREILGLFFVWAWMAVLVFKNLNKQNS
jgi:hypothetical protein